MWKNHYRCLNFIPGDTLHVINIWTGINSDGNPLAEGVPERCMESIANMGGQFGQLSPMEKGRSTAQMCEVKRVKRAIRWRSEGKILKAYGYLAEALYNSNLLQASVLNMKDFGDSLLAPQCTALKHYHISLLLQRCPNTPIKSPRS
jgi:hypothetical protein